MTVDVATSAQRVVLTDGTAPEDLANGAAVTISTAGSAVTQGHARLVVDWAMSCGGVTNPPDRRSPALVGVAELAGAGDPADAHLLAAYRVACPELQPDDFTSSGWPTV